MPETAQKFQMTAAAYQGLFAPPTALPSREELFDFQVETLVGKKLGQYADADPFRNRLAELSNDRFLLTPKPPKVLNLAELMAKVQLNGKMGQNFLDDAYLKDIGKYPMTASLLVDVEDGTARLNVKPIVSRENIANEGRHPYNTWRGIIHVAVMPWVLNLHYMDLVGSRFHGGCVPFLYLDDVEPALRSYWEGCASPEWGAPSAGSVWV